MKFFCQRLNHKHGKLASLAKRQKAYCSIWKGMFRKHLLLDGDANQGAYHYWPIKVY